jgi:hypothetical protein
MQRRKNSPANQRPQPSGKRIPLVAAVLRVVMGVGWDYWGDVPTWVGFVLILFRIERRPRCAPRHHPAAARHPSP